jgi:5-methylcytosine-specific restriction endonuclease McrA
MRCRRGRCLIECAPTMGKSKPQRPSPPSTDGTTVAATAGATTIADGKPILRSRLRNRSAVRGELSSKTPSRAASPNECIGETVKPPPDLRGHLIDLRSKRRQGKQDNVKPPRVSLTAAERLLVLAKTSGRCHICGGTSEDERLQADHVKARSAGGTHEVDNYLPAHSTCNNYRWDYLPEEFRYILKLGVWARTQIERGTTVGNDIASAFAGYETRRVKRRVPN